jgi:predicted dinucleotide-binding enzyme
VTTAIVGVGNIGGALARHLVAGGESVVLAAKDRSRAEALAKELGPLAHRGRGGRRGRRRGCRRLSPLARHDQGADPAVCDARLLEDKVVVDPSNPIGFGENGQMTPSLPERQSADSVVAALLPAGAHYVKAFGTLSADALAGVANRDPRRAVLFYATDDGAAATTIERLIRAAGFDPFKAGGVADSGRIEAPGGDLHQFGFNGELVDLDRARTAVAAKPPA